MPNAPGDPADPCHTPPIFPDAIFQRKGHTPAFAHGCKPQAKVLEGTSAGCALSRQPGHPGRLPGHEEALRPLGLLPIGAILPMQTIKTHQTHATPRTPPIRTGSHSSSCQHVEAINPLVACHRWKVELANCCLLVSLVARQQAPVNPDSVPDGIEEGGKPRLGHLCGAKCAKKNRRGEAQPCAFRKPLGPWPAMACTRHSCAETRHGARDATTGPGQAGQTETIDKAKRPGKLDPKDWPSHRFRVDMRMVPSKVEVGRRRLLFVSWDCESTVAYCGAKGVMFLMACGLRCNLMD